MSAIGLWAIGRALDPDTLPDDVIPHDPERVRAVYVGYAVITIPRPLFHCWEQAQRRPVPWTALADALEATRRQVWDRATPIVRFAAGLVTAAVRPTPQPVDPYSDVLALGLFLPWPLGIWPCLDWREVVFVTDPAFVSPWPSVPDAAWRQGATLAAVRDHLAAIHGDPRAAQRLCEEVFAEAVFPHGRLWVPRPPWQFPYR